MYMYAYILINIYNVHVLIIVLMDYRIGAANNHNSIAHKQIPRLHTYVYTCTLPPYMCRHCVVACNHVCLRNFQLHTYNQNACKCDFSKCHVYVHILVDLQQLVTYVRNNNRLSQFVFITTHQGHALYILIIKQILQLQCCYDFCGIVLAVAVHVVDKHSFCLLYLCIVDVHNFIVA